MCIYMSKMVLVNFLFVIVTVLVLVGVATFNFLCP